MRLFSLCVAVLAGAALSSVARAGDPPRYDLDELRAIARSCHPSLESAQAVVQQAEAAGKQASLLADPEARFEYRRAEAGELTDSEYLVELAQVFTGPGLRKARARAGDGERRQAEAARLEAEAAVDFAVNRLYVRLLLAKQGVEVAQESEEVSRRLAELLGRRVEVGESPPLEALKAETETYSRRQASIDALSLLDAARSELNALCGNRLGSDFEIAGSLGGSTELPPVEELFARLERDNPLILAARAAVDAAAARADAEHKLRVPSLTVSATHEAELDKDSNGIGVGMAIPLWNRNQNGIAAAGAGTARARAELRVVTLDVRSALERAVHEHAAAGAVVGLYDEGWSKVAEQVVAIAEYSFVNGEASLLELLDAQRGLLAARMDEVEARARLASSTLEIERLLGGKPIQERTDEPR
jgi:cobalt-zinc-cadmium efflux system outer membrane protein